MPIDLSEASAELCLAIASNRRAPGWQRVSAAPLLARQLEALMKRYGLAVISARYTAMIEAVAELPPIVISDLFGICPRTA